MRVNSINFDFILTLNTHKGEKGISIFVVIFHNYQLITVFDWIGRADGYVLLIHKVLHKVLLNHFKNVPYLHLMD